MTFLSAGILAAFGVAYLSATIAPLIDTASPIRTPLTTLVLQFFLARNLLRKMSLCVIKVASIMRSQVGAGALVCWRPVKKSSSIIAEVGRVSREWLWNWTNPIRLILSCKSDAADVQPPSEIPEHIARIIAKQWLEPFAEIWSDNTLCTSDLDTIKESTALDYSLTKFFKREIESLSWTLEHTTNDGELLLFLEGIPVYLNSRWSDLHFGKPQTRFNQSPAQVLRALLQHPASTFLLKLDTFIFTRYKSMSQRDASAVVNALSSLFEKEVYPYTEGIRFLHSRSSSRNLRWFMIHAIELHPSLSPTIRRLKVAAVLRCAQARGSKYDTTSNDLYCWPYSSVLVPVASFRYSELRSFWDAIGSFLGFGWRYCSALTSWTAAKAATAAETNPAITLFSLCLFFWEAVPDPQAHFTDTFHDVMYELISHVSPLAEGSAGAQQAYSAAVFIITSALEEASSKLEHGKWYWRTVYEVSVKFLRPLVKVTDDAAAETAQRVLCSPLWSTRLPDNIPSSWLQNPKLNQTICARRLIESLRGYHRPSIPANVTTLAGVHSTMQIVLAESLEGWLDDIFDNVADISFLIRLLGTFDEPKAVIDVQRALHKFLTTPQTENNFDAAGEALTELKAK